MGPVHVHWVVDDLDEVNVESVGQFDLRQCRAGLYEYSFSFFGVLVNSVFIVKLEDFFSWRS